MSESSQRRDRSGDISWAMQPDPRTTCWFCKHPNPTGTYLFGGNRGGGGTKIAVCAPGEGCRDGRIFHGPQGAPHYPDQDCPICGPAEIAIARRLAGNAPKKAAPRRNRSPRHR